MAYIFFEIPTVPDAQRFSITLDSVTYIMRLVYRDTDMGGWILDIADNNNNDIVCGIPLVTGCDLLAQYAYLGIKGVLISGTDGNLLLPATFTNLGSAAHLWFGTV